MNFLEDISIKKLIELTKTEIKNVKSELDDVTSSMATNANIIITLEADDPSILTQAVITATNVDTEEVIEEFTYDGNSHTITMPLAIKFKISCSDIDKYKTPKAKKYIANGSNPQLITLKYEYGTRYGFKRTKAEASPTGRIEYLFDAVGVEPAYMDFDNDKFEYGGWENFINQVARPVMLKYDGTVDYELDHDNQSLKLDGTASDISNTSYGGNAMVEFREFKWVKRYEDTNYEYVIFSDVQFDDEYTAYAHTNENGEIKDAFYWGMFKGTNVNGTLRSMGTGSPMVSQTRNTEVSYAKNNGSGYYTIYKSGWDFISDLLTLISKSDNS